MELAVEALGPLIEELVLIGGCAVGLLITDRARPPVRPTIDVDLVTEVATLSNYYALCDRLRGVGFKDGDIICRFSKGNVLIDIVPTDEAILKFTNRWYAGAAKNAVPWTLKNGRQIRLITAPFFLATKIESFHSRGNGDYLHHDIEDIINLVDGRAEIVKEVQAAEGEVREFLQQEFDDLLADPGFMDRMPWLLNPDEVSQARLPLILDRLRALAGL